MSNKTWIINGVNSWATQAPDIWEYAKARPIWAISGPLGAGKTAFSQAMAAHLGYKEVVDSPTFSLVNEYTIQEGLAAKIYHLDLYRLNSMEEALSLGIEEILDQNDCVWIEWPEVIEPILSSYGDKVFHLEIIPIAESSRKMLIL